MSQKNANPGKIEAPNSNLNPSGYSNPERAADMRLMVGIAAHLTNGSVRNCLRFAGDLAEDVNAHTEAAAIHKMADAIAIKIAERASPSVISTPADEPCKELTCKTDTDSPERHRLPSHVCVLHSDSRGHWITIQNGFESPIYTTKADAWRDAAGRGCRAYVLPGAKLFRGNPRELPIPYKYISQVSIQKYLAERDELYWQLDAMLPKNWTQLIFEFKGSPDCTLPRIEAMERVVHMLGNVKLEIDEAEGCVNIYVWGAIKARIFRLPQHASQPTPNRMGAI